jgi:hypothetical protein
MPILYWCQKCCVCAEWSTVYTYVSRNNSVSNDALFFLIWGYVKLNTCNINICLAYVC